MRNYIQMKIMRKQIAIQSDIISFLSHYLLYNKLMGYKEFLKHSIHDPQHMRHVGTGVSTAVFANTYTFQGHRNTIIDGYLPRYGVSQERHSINI